MNDGTENICTHGGRWRKTWQAAQACVLAAALVFAAGCGTPKRNVTVHDEPSDPVVARLSRAARTAYDKGSLETAMSLYREALNRAKASDDSAQIAKNAYELGSCLYVLGQVSEAKPLLEEARMEYRRIGGDVSKVLLVEADAARAQGLNQEAEALAGALLVELGADADPVDMAQMHLLKAEIACDRHVLSAARRELDHARGYAEMGNQPAIEAEISRVQGRIHLIDDNAEGAAKEFDSEAYFLQQSGKYRRMALATGRAGLAYRDLGDNQIAAYRFYVAARSLFAQGDVVAALRMIEPAVAAAEAAGDVDVKRRTISLFKEIQAAVEGDDVGESS